MTTTVNTNPGAFVALKNLASVQNQLLATQKRVSTGYTVADAFDNGAVFGVAQLVRSDIAGNAAASAELGNFSGALQTANAAATQISDTLSDIRAVLTHLSATGVTATQVSQYIQQYTNYVDSVKSAVNGAGYNGTNLLSSNATFKVLADGAGNTIEVIGSKSGILAGATGTGDSAYTVLSSLSTVLTGVNLATAGAVDNVATSVQNYLKKEFVNVSNSTSTVLNYIGALNRSVSQQLTFNNSIRDALSVGLGALVDSDLAHESAILTALQVKQQLSTQALSIANQSPNILTTLFR